VPSCAHKYRLRTVERLFVHLVLSSLAVVSQKRFRFPSF
jgi:hypothetical protein